jgi:GNAT superfamily N-acetyltransferase
LKKKQALVLRAARAGDLRALALVHQAAFSSGSAAENWTERAASARIAQVLKSKDPAWVACLYRQPVGFVFVSLRQGVRGPYGEITELAVHPFFQGQGIGTRLLKKLKEARKRLRLTTLYGLVYKGTAEGFFKKCRFKLSRRSSVFSLHP